MQPPAPRQGTMAARLLVFALLLSQVVPGPAAIPLPGNATAATADPPTNATATVEDITAAFIGAAPGPNTSSPPPQPP